MRTEQNFNLKTLNTFGLNAIAERYVAVQSRDELEGYFENSWAMPSLVLGGGSNLLITGDVAGTVMHVQIQGIEEIRETEDHVYVRAGAGVVWNDLVVYCIERGLGGVENLSLIPGYVGAAPMQNIGAYGVELREVFDSLEAYFFADKIWKTFDIEDCRFGYRESVFKHELRGRVVISSVTLRLSKKPTFRTDYGAIREELDKMGVTELSVRAVSDAVIHIRRSKLPDPAKLGNCGSFFKNPVVTKEVYECIRDVYPDVVAYPAGDDYKLAAGWLIEKAGFKGKRFGNCGVHDRQALVLVNYGGATGSELLSMSETIVQDIFNRFGVLLEREVNVV